MGAATASISTSKEIPQDCPGPWVSEMLTHAGSFWVSVNLLKYDLQENAEIIKVPMHYILAESNAVTMIIARWFFLCISEYVSFFLSITESDILNSLVAA